jgi:hypothetical protein
MPTLISEEKRTNSKAPYYKRMIRCPGHYLIPPTVDVYLHEPVALLKDCSNWVEFMGRKITIKKTRIAKDKWGNKKIDWKKLYELRAKGIVLNPIVSAAWAIEHIYDPSGILCNFCPKYCKEGQGRVVTATINRLQGIPIKHR